MKTLFFILLLFTCWSARADDGYDLWLKYKMLPSAAEQKTAAGWLSQISTKERGDIVNSAVNEIQRAVKGWTGKEAIVLSNATAGVRLEIRKLDNVHPDAYEIKKSGKTLLIIANSPNGLLYGTFAMLRNFQINGIDSIEEKSGPKINLRLLNHWDNNDGTIERGYAGKSLWKWADLPEVLDPRYTDYARANASVGINGVVVNNVNASARFLTPEYLEKVAALAAVFRKYGITTYLSVNFASPKLIGGLKTADPLDPEVKAWWKSKTDEVYKTIPDFGGYLVKANSEGEPGPMDYGRTHADGANMLAEALAPHQGILTWRAFVYNSDPKEDRFAQAYKEFKPFDGKFLPNVIIQVKNGPIDFMPREPFSPLFGALEKTPTSMEFQLTQEYLGQSTHWVYEGPMFEEVLRADTFVKGVGSTVAKVVDGSVFKNSLTSMVGVANTGSDRNWTGHIMAQANWYTFGRLAWDHNLVSDQIAEEWIKQTLNNKPTVVKTIKEIMLDSREVYVNYTYPLGLHHMMGEGHHYGPEPWLKNARRQDWTSHYYHRADSVGLGFDRTSTGFNTIAQYHPEFQKIYGNVSTTPLTYLMWFHHLPWNFKLSTGNTLWNEIVKRYYGGVEDVAKMQVKWTSLKGDVDKELFENVSGKLSKQHREAQWWRDACVQYFQKYSGMPIPEQYPKPTMSLEEAKKIVDVYHVR